MLKCVRLYVISELSTKLIIIIIIIIIYIDFYGVILRASDTDHIWQYRYFGI